MYRLLANSVGKDLKHVIKNSLLWCKSQSKPRLIRQFLKPVTQPRSDRWISKTSLRLAGIGTFGSLAVTIWSASTVKCDALKRSDAYKATNNGAQVTEFSWKAFWELIKPEWFYMLSAVISALLVAYANIGIPLQLGELVNALAKCATGHVDNFYELIRAPAVHLLTKYVIQSFFTFAYISLLSHCGERMAARMRKQLFNRIIRQDIAFFDANKTGEIVHRLTSDVQDFKSSFKTCIAQGLRATTQIIGSGTALLLISPGLASVLMVLVPSLVGIGWMFGSGLRILSKKAQLQMSHATAIADEAVGNVRTVRAFAMENMETELFDKEVNKSCQYNQNLGYGIGMFQGLTNLALNGMVLGVLIGGGSLMANHQLSAGDLMSFLVSTQTIQRSMGQLSMLYGYAIRGMSAGARVFEYMDLNPSLSTADVGVKIPYHSLHGNVVFSNVQFAYPTRPEQPVLKNLCLTIPGGKVTALVGLSGGGKSTVAVLLERFYEVDKGSITIDGVDISKCSPKWLRGRAIGFISQEPVLFATSVLENIRYGRPEATDAEGMRLRNGQKPKLFRKHLSSIVRTYRFTQRVIEAAKLANAHTFIKSFPESYDTILGERGVTVSGGQKQRIAIARALLKNPSIVILDEATSALDSESERLVQEALDRAIKGRTVLVIAHRLSTIKDADVIAVMDQGKVLEVGNHKQLTKKKGAYWRLTNSQDNSEW